MVKAYAYGRVSHRDQIAQDDSIPAQESRTKGYFDFKLAPEGVEWGSFEADQVAVSAYRKPFCKRVAGMRLLAKLQPGDHIIFDKIDRVWRSIADFVDLVRQFKSDNITVHFVNLRGASVQMDTPMGDFVISLMVLLAELESATTSSRIKEFQCKARTEGRWTGNAKAPLGTTIVGEKRNKTRRLVWDYAGIALMNEVIELMDVRGMNFHQIADKLEAEICTARGVAFQKSAFRKRTIDRDTVEARYHRGKLIQKVGTETDPNTVCFTKNRKYESLKVLKA